MPVVGIPLETLYKFTGRRIEKEELYGHLTSLGCDVEGYFEVSRFACASCGELVELTSEEEVPQECSSCGTKFVTGQTLVSIGQSEIVRMELVPARPDMFDVGGLSRALRGYLGIETGMPQYELSSSGMAVKVLKSVKSVRPSIACAVVRGIVLDDETIRILMKMQENLHWAMGRDRRKVSIGVYDLATLSPDFEYCAFGKAEKSFVPLGGMPGEGLKAVVLQEILERHPKGVAYKHLLLEYDSYPILTDSRGQVLSMPPIINSEETKTKTGTKDLFVDVTGHDRKSVERTLNVLVCSLAELGGKIQTVRIVDGKEETETPNLEPRETTLVPLHASSLIGAKISAPLCVELLQKMRFDAHPSSGSIGVSVPPYRTDIMHECDLIEDIAIAYGYHNIKRTLVPTMTVGIESELEKTSARVRRCMTGLGFLEVVTSLLSNPEKNYTSIAREDDGKAVLIENPATTEQTMLRTHLISGLLDMFKLNRTHRMPQKIFELGDLTLLDERGETGTVDRRALAAAIMDPKTGFAEIKSCAQAAMKEEGIEAILRQERDPSFLPGRCAAIYKGEDLIGLLGEIHPQVLENFEIVQPVSLFHLLVD
jgi:phenylalanyl-tRNA synthetase beta chain